MGGVSIGGGAAPASGLGVRGAIRGYMLTRPVRAFLGACFGAQGPRYPHSSTAAA